MRSRVLNSYHFYAAVTAVLWSLAYVFTRLALRSFTPFALGFLRYLCASVAMAAYLILTRAGLPRRAHIGLLALSGVCGFALYMVLFNIGSTTESSATASTVVATVPLITALLSRIFCKERLTGMQSAAIVLSFLGVVLLTVMKMTAAPGPGVFFIFAGAVILSVYNLLQKRLTRTCKPIVATGYSIFFGTAMLAVFAPAAVRQLPAASGTDLACVGVLGVFCGAVAYCCWTKAMSMAQNTASVTNYMFVEPFIAAAFGWLLNGERLDGATVAGGVVIILGMALFYFGPHLFPRLAGAAPEANAMKTEEKA